MPRRLFPKGERPLCFKRLLPQSEYPFYNRHGNTIIIYYIGLKITNLVNNPYPHCYEVSVLFTVCMAGVCL